MSRRLAIAAAAVALGSTLLTGVALAQQQSEDAKNALRAQADRALVVYRRGKMAHYKDTFDLSGMPHYQPYRAADGLDPAARQQLPGRRHARRLLAAGLREVPARRPFLELPADLGGRVRGALLQPGRPGDGSPARLLRPARLRAGHELRPDRDHRGHGLVRCRRLGELDHHPRQRGEPAPVHQHGTARRHLRLRARPVAGPEPTGAPTGRAVRRRTSAPGASSA